mmetsp:Transcript_6218/g.6159  ORF Transcript_6218/g.6159 Transcript_6218/m.6159 type:complete len:146 (-) Transcript_6218:10-447(-)
MTNTASPIEEPVREETVEDKEFQRALELVEKRLKDMEADYEETLAAERPKEEVKGTSIEELGYGPLRSDSDESSDDEEEEFGAFISGEVREERMKGSPSVVHPKQMSLEDRQRIREAMASMPKPDEPEWARGLTDDEFLKAALSR